MFQRIAEERQLNISQDFNLITAETNMKSLKCVKHKVRGAQEGGNPHGHTAELHELDTLSVAKRLRSNLKH